MVAPAEIPYYSSFSFMCQEKYACRDPFTMRMRQLWLGKITGLSLDRQEEIMAKEVYLAFLNKQEFCENHI